MDPAAALLEATERNAREAREEREAEAMSAPQAEAEAATKARADVAAKAQAEADANAAEDPTRNVAPDAANLPVVEGQTPTGTAGASQTAPEREWTDSVIPEVEVAPHALDAGERGSKPEGPELSPSSAELVVSRAVTTRASARQRPAWADSVPRPAGAEDASSHVANTESSSSAPAGWAPGAGPGVLKVTVKDVLDQFNTHAATLLTARNELLAIQTSVRVATQLRTRVGELKTELQAKEQQRSQAAVERARLAKEPADQAAQHKEEVRQLKDGETLLKAEFETERSDWDEWEKLMSDNYEVI
nr:translation initiation factor IF-2-like [Aegilops tauschii subsp. strangulata]